MARWGPSRRREFATARWCARLAMAVLGRPPTAIPRDRGGHRSGRLVWSGASPTAGATGLPRSRGPNGSPPWVSTARRAPRCRTA
ncbi:MAG: hypothetical protein J2P14_16805 [Acidothermales bacterium]|nr:hypothetical protein [Acidothermales bacterium]